MVPETRRTHRAAQRTSLASEGLSEYAGGSQTSGSARPRWTDELRTELMTMYEQSKPAESGYMNRLHALWIQKYPQWDGCTKQLLRDQAKYLQRKGWSIKGLSTEKGEKEKKIKERKKKRTDKDQKTIWTEDLKKDLLEAYKTSDPNKKSYMNRLKEIWDNKHPDMKHLTQQNLRDQVDYLRRKGGNRSDRPAIKKKSKPKKLVEPAINTKASDDCIEETMRGKFKEEIKRTDITERKIKIHHKAHYIKKHLEIVNKIIGENIDSNSTMWDLNCAIYAGAKVLLATTSTPRKKDKSKSRQKKLDRKLITLRRKVSHIQCWIDIQTGKYKKTNKIKKIIKRLTAEFHTTNLNNIKTIREELKDKIRALAAARRQVLKRKKWIEQNHLFDISPAKVLEKQKDDPKQKPCVEKVEQFWKSIMQKEHNPCSENRPVMKEFSKFCNKFQPAKECQHINIGDFRRSLSQMKNFSAPGLDRINAYWLKQFYATHDTLLAKFNNILLNRESFPDWLTEGKTVLIYKNGDPSKPQNYRPITCLNSMYKLFTKLLNEKLLRDVEPVWKEIYEQRGTKRGSCGTKENLIIDQAICQDARQYKRNLTMCWIDYKKAFDSVSHEWLKEVLQNLPIHPVLRNCLNSLTKQWKTRFWLDKGKTQKKTNVIKYKRGIYQGDSLSPILFCLSMLPLSTRLRKEPGYLTGKPGHRIHKVTHLFYVDDLKIYAANRISLRKAIGVVEAFTAEAGMEIGTDKCGVISIHRGRWEQTQEDIPLLDGSVLKHLQPTQSYKYLGLEQNTMIDAKTVKARALKNYYATVDKIWKTELSGKKKIAATNMLAVPLITYYFGVIRWTEEDLANIDRDTRKVLTNNLSHHPRSSTQRLYLSRSEGGRGLINIQEMHDRQVISILAQINTAVDPLMKMVKEHENTGVGAFLKTIATHAIEKLSMDSSLLKTEKKDLQKITKDIAQKQKEKKLQDHLQKPLHGRYFNTIVDSDCSKQQTYTFLKSSSLKSETEGFIIAAQDGVIDTLYYRKNILKQNIENINCRACNSSIETQFHLISNCPVYAKTLYIERHNAALKELYSHLRHKMNFDDEKRPSYTLGNIQTIVTNDKGTLFWNHPFATTRQLTANKPDMVVLINLTKQLVVIEFTCPDENNIKSKYIEKRNKYKDLLFELRKTYLGFKVTLVVLIVGALGGIPRVFQASLKEIPYCQNHVEILTSSMQKSVILGTLRILRAHGSQFPST